MVFKSVHFARILLCPRPEPLKMRIVAAVIFTIVASFVSTEAPGVSKASLSAGGIPETPKEDSISKGSPESARSVDPVPGIGNSDELSGDDLAKPAPSYSEESVSEDKRIGGSLEDEPSAIADDPTKLLYAGAAIRRVNRGNSTRRPISLVDIIRGVAQTTKLAQEATAAYNESGVAGVADYISKVPQITGGIPTIELSDATVSNKRGGALVEAQLDRNLPVSGLPFNFNLTRILPQIVDQIFTTKLMKDKKTGVTMRVAVLQLEEEVFLDVFPPE